MATDTEKNSIDNSTENRRVEETLQEVLAYTHGLGIVQGTYTQQSDFVNLVINIPLYQMFNANVIARIENEIITKSVVRDFVLTLYTQFATVMSLRYVDFSSSHLIGKLESIAINNFSLGSFDANNNKSLIKNLRDAIVPINIDFPKSYMIENNWYIIVVLINVFSISLIKVMDDIKRPPVNPEGT